MRKQIILFAISFLIMNISIAQPARSATGNYKEGIRLKDEKKYAEAIVLFKKTIAAQPTNKEALFEAGWCSNELEKYQDAISFLQKAKSLWPNESKVYFEIGYSYQQLEKPEEAKKNYTRCLSLNKEYALAYKSLGNLFFDQRDYTAALENYKAYISYTKDDISSSDFYYNKGYAENDLEKYTDAIESLNKSIELKNDAPRSFDELAYAYYKQDDADNAIKYYNSSIALKADGYVPYIGLGDVYKDLKKDNDEALKNYLKAIENKPENEKSQYSIGWCYNEKEQYNEAIPYLKKAILINKDYLKANRELGYSYYALGEYSNAQALFNKTISLDKKDELSFYYSGLCFVGMKDKTAALKMYDSLQELQSTYADKLKTKIDSM